MAMLEETTDSLLKTTLNSPHPLGAILDFSLMCIAETLGSVLILPLFYLPKTGQSS